MAVRRPFRVRGSVLFGFGADHDDRDVAKACDDGVGLGFGEGHFFARFVGVPDDRYAGRFRARGGPLGESAYNRAWHRARREALTPAQVASPLAGRPYDLRHAAVSLWLNAGVGPQQVAAWAGHSVQVLLKVYAKCLDGAEEAARGRVEAALEAA